MTNYEPDPCDKIVCNGTNAECQVYVEGPQKGVAFCICPKGFTGDPQVNCCKNF